ncbi:Hypothetical protein I5071_7980 [Sandaracinus amylolyticus]|nr:Hypothetical protein I5071_7980 [Sandaracinus amylolyticus]
MFCRWMTHATDATIRMNATNAIATKRPSKRRAGGREVLAEDEVTRVFWAQDFFLAIGGGGGGVVCSTSQASDEMKSTPSDSVLSARSG